MFTGKALRLARQLAAALACGYVLIYDAPSVSALCGVVGDPGNWSARWGFDAAALTIGRALLWCLGLWLAIALLATQLGRLPGPAGAVGRWATEHFVPGAIRHVLTGTLGIGIALSPAHLSSGTTHQVAFDTPARPASVSAVVKAPQTPPWAAAVTSPSWPDTQPPPPPPTPPTEKLTVHPGDSLWALAAHRLPADATDGAIETTWQDWYQHNRSVIGPDPDLLAPGLILTIPSERS